MSTLRTMNGATYLIPDQGDTFIWGIDLSGWVGATSNGTLQKTGGAFTLAADVDFGPNFGVKSAYLSSRTANPASAGIVRLANTDTIQFRNAANSGNNTLSMVGDVLTYSGTFSATSITGISANSLTGTTLASNVVNSSLTALGTLTGLTVSGTVTGAGLVQAQKVVSTYNGVAATTGLAGDFVSRRSATQGVYYFGDQATSYLYFDGTNYIFGQPGSATVSASTFTGSLIGTASNSTTVGGFTPSATSGTASRVVVADGSGYIFNTYFNSSDNSATSGVTAIMVKAGDNYLRSGTAAATVAFLNGTPWPTFAVAANGATTDPYGAIAVTNPSNSTNYSYFGLTRAGQIGVNVGIDTSNRFFIGSGGSGTSADVTTRPFTVDPAVGTVTAAVVNATGLSLGGTTNGYVNLTRGGGANSGYIEFLAFTSGTRQGYIGFCATNNSQDAGVIPFVMAKASFSAQVTAGSTFIGNGGTKGWGGITTTTTTGTPTGGTSGDFYFVY